MKSLVLAAGAVLVLLAAGPAMAGGPRGGHGCGQCGGGHTPPPPPPPPSCCHGGRNTNINVNVNASASASASASARSYLGARTWSGGSMSRGYAGGGTVYVGGGYGGDIGYVAGPVVYGETPLAYGRACAPAPFGYTLHGFGREIGAPARCDSYDYGYEAAYREDRGGRYGYSERRDSWSEESYREESYREERYAEAYGYEEVRRDDHDCGCDERPPAPYPPAYLPEPPRYTPPPAPRPHRARPAPRPSHHRPAPQPRQHYAQEPGERG